MPRYFRVGQTWISGPDPRRVAALFAASPDTAYPLMTTYSGHVREAAVRAARAPAGPFQLALLVFRLNDWVTQVRDAAAQKLTAIDPTLRDSDIAACVEFLWEFDRVGRADDRGRKLVHDLVTRPGVLTLLRGEALKGATDRAVRLLRWLMRTEILDADLPLLATRGQRAHIRAMATRALLTQSYSWNEHGAVNRRAVPAPSNAEALARAALSNSAAIVQLAGLEYVVAHGQSWAGYQAILLRFASHSRRSLSELAQWALNKEGVDWIAYARKWFAEYGYAETAAVLGKHGNAKDGANIWARASSLPDGRALPFLAAAAKLKVAPAVERLTEIALHAEQIGLARRASTALVEAEARLGAGVLQEITDRRGGLFARGLGRHLVVLGVMAQLNILARAERSGDMDDLDLWLATLRRKLNRGAFSTTGAEADALRPVLPHAPRVRAWMHAHAIEV